MPPGHEHPSGCWDDSVAEIACCPIHGLHGERDECYVCGGPVEKILMKPVYPDDLPFDFGVLEL